LVAALGSVIPAHAQDSGEASASNPNSSLPNLAGTGEVKLQVERFGVGGLSRPGEWAGIRIRFLDSSPKQRDIIIRLSGLDPDGDTPLVQREITANPGVWQSTWMYCRLPFWFKDYSQSGGFQYAMQGGKPRISALREGTIDSLASDARALGQL
jgi:hypothetical protein